ncbi:MAG: hypothetical protein QG657_3110, partial [Acidobacteriota bacterium]|nr:hypothetical protein [Acidobacteriota bacterium]
MEKIDPQNIGNILALTPIQEGMLFHYLKDPRSGLYFEQLSLEISGSIDAALFEKAWNVVIQSNEMLRTVFRWEKVEKPSQVILREHLCEIRYHDLARMDDDQKKTALAKVKTDDRDEDFDLTRVPFRVILCQLAETQYEMIISNHHILYDGWSNGIILKEFFNAYYSLSKGKQRLKLPVKTSFKEFVRWLQNQDKIKQEQYWGNYLAGFEMAAELPIKRKNENTTGVGDYSIILGEDIQKELEYFRRNNKVTLASIFFSAWGLLLQRYCGGEDVVFGTTVSGRSAGVKGIEDMVGLFINTIPLRINTNANEKIIDVVLRTDQILRDREEFENTPLMDIGGRDVARNVSTLFDTILAIENYPLDGHLLPEGCPLSITSYAMSENTHYDLSVGIMPFNGLEIKFSYKQELFDNDTIETLAGHFKTIIQKLIEQPETVSSQLEIISIGEKSRILYEFNSTAADYPANKTIHQLFEEQVEKRSDAVGPVGPVGLSYKKLNEQSDRLAGLLIEKGVQRDTIVGIMVERSIEMVIGIFGILKAGGAYLPIDPDYPQERIDYMLKDSGAQLLVNEKFFGGVRGAVLQKSPPTGSNLAYIIYTSGSTGKPKGVMIEHRSVVNLLFALQNQYPFAPSDSYLLKTSYTFDVSVTELFGWYMGGGKLIILEVGDEKDPEVILNWVQRYWVTHINFVPSMFNAFSDFVTEENKGRLSGLKYIFLAGEALLSSQVKKFTDLNTAIELENIYGPTEGTVYASKYSLSEWNGIDSVPIGKPLPNIELYILDKYNHLQPPGIVGELIITGSGTARGYLNRPELTREAFEKAPAGTYPPKLLINHHSPLYHTGDLARWLSDGNIEFLGRIDQQIKIRGFRIELGEIENRLLKHKKINEAVVLAKEDTIGDKYLGAYYVASLEIPVMELREYLQKDLPDYMIPSYFMRLNKIPLTPSGKVDRRALPDPELKPQEVYMAPRNKIERKLVEIWGRVLGKGRSVNPIGIDDNFFRLGGHSLKATSLVSLIHKTFNVQIPLGEIFKRPTIRQLFDYINNAVKEQYVLIEPVEEKEYYMLSSAEKRLYVLQQMDNVGTAYNISAAWILVGRIDENRLEQSIKTLILRHESLRTSFVVIGQEPIRRIHEQVQFKIESKVFGPTFFQKGGFDLSQAPLIRVGLRKIEEEEHILVVEMHHIISDGVSAEILIREFTTLYQGGELPAISLRYRDYAEWQKRSKQGENFLRQSAYWKKEFAGEIPVLELPGDYARPAVQSFEGDRISFTIGREVVESLNSLAFTMGATVYMVLIAAYGIFLAKLSGQEDIIIGTPVGGRRYAEFENIIGVFVNTLALRMYPAGEKSFIEFLGEIKERTLEAFENQDYQYEDLVDELAVGRDAGRNPLYDVMFVLQNMGSGELEIPGLKLISNDLENKTSKFDLTLTAVEIKGELEFTFEYCTKLFKHETMGRFIIYYKNIVSII